MIHVTPVVSDELAAIRDRIMDLSIRNIAPRVDLFTSEVFPVDLWQEMGREDLLGIGIPREYGGSGLGYLGSAVAGMALAESSRCLGFTLSWIMNQIIARFFLVEFGNRSQNETYLPALAQGDLIGAVAMSEPGIGAHPKHVHTTARRQGDAYVLNGEKAYITNGPLAGFFTVLAVTGHAHGKKQFTAFIIDRDTRGLKIKEPMDIGSLRPCQHCGITLEGCTVPGTAVLGTVGDAYLDMVIPFREIEDALMMGPVIGAMRAQLALIRDQLRKNRTALSDDILGRLGNITSLLHTLEVIALEAA
ncbi:MAG: acyl-CoA dehydrogenase family protein, partial [Desulfomonilia bacterium]